MDYEDMEKEDVAHILATGELPAAYRQQSMMELAERLDAMSDQASVSAAIQRKAAEGFFRLHEKIWTMTAGMDNLERADAWRFFVFSNRIASPLPVKLFPDLQADETWREYATRKTGRDDPLHNRPFFLARAIDGVRHEKTECAFPLLVIDGDQTADFSSGVPYFQTRFETDDEVFERVKDAVIDTRDFNKTFQNMWDGEDSAFPKALTTRLKRAIALTRFADTPLVFTDSDSSDFFRADLLQLFDDLPFKHHAFFRIAIMGMDPDFDRWEGSLSIEHLQEQYALVSLLYADPWERGEAFARSFKTKGKAA